MKKFDFSRTPTTNIQRSSFDRSHNHLTTIDFAKLYPIICEEILPADTVKLRTSGFLRLSTPLHPVMSSMHVETFYFFVPLRIVWDNFTKMMGVQENPNDSTDYLVPQIICPTGGWPEGSFEDYIGVPTQVEGADYSALYRRAATMIYNEWFRDANLKNSILFVTSDGPDYPTQDNTINGIYRQLIPLRGRRHDYFSSCLPSTQIGDPVLMPLEADIVGAGTANSSGFNNYLFGEESYNQGYFRSLSSGADIAEVEAFSNKVGADWGDEALDLRFQLDNTSITINQLRQAMQLQVFYERDNRGGRRWPELLKAHFQTDLPDNQYRPLYLGGGQAHVNIHPVPTTAGGDSGTAVTGELGSFGTCSFSGHGFTQSFSEHGILLGFVSARSQQLYQQGMHRQFTRKDRLDFYWSSFNQIGDEAVLNSEIYFQGTAEDDAAFGFQERFSSYRYAPSRVSGLFRSNATSGSLDAWHTADYYESLPTLGSTWINDPSDTNVDRVVATPDEPQLICDFYHKINHIRPMPMHSTPANLGRF